MPSTTTNDPWTLPELTRARRAIVVVDVVESVRLMQEDEAGFIERWRRFVHQVRHEVLPKHGGRMVKSLGDGMLLEFDSERSSVLAALAILELHASTTNPVCSLRCGAHAAEVASDLYDVYGSGVNLAARLCALAGPDELVVSAHVRDAVADGVDARVTDLGDCHLKHFDQSVRAFRVQAASYLQAPLQASAAVGAFSRADLTVTVAIVPFECLDAEHQASSLGNALCDALTAKLCRLPGLRIVSRLSTAAMTGQLQIAPACREHLGAHFVVHGTYRGTKTRVTGIAHVTDTQAGTVAWSDGFRVEVTRMFANQDHGVDELAAVICKAITDATLRRSRSLPVPNLDSYELLLGSVSLLHRLRKDDFARSAALLNALREREPRAAVPLALLAKWHLLRVLQGWAPRSDGQRGLELAHEALNRESDHPLALALAGLIGMHFGQGLAEAREMAVRAIDADPQEPNGWVTLAAVESYLYRGPSSVEAARKAIALSPLDPCRFLFDLMLAAGQLASGCAEEAIESANASLRLNAVHAPSWRMAVIANMLSGRLEAAQGAAHNLISLDPRFRVAEFAERYPGRDQPHAASYVQALRDAGLPY